jgi:F-type H+-transporting ATPase subunit alpha
MSLAEHARDRGDDALVVFDDLSRHARAYREVSLLLRRPPGREAFPGDIFYIHSRLLERSTRLRDRLGGGSVTALPVIETEAQNISAYIPTNLISITDGQIYLSPGLFQKGIMPAVDVGRSVSRVGGDAQLPAYRAVAGDLRLAYSQFQELESFARFGTRLDEETRATLTRGRRVREALKQSQHDTMPVAEQIAVLLAVTQGELDDLAVERVGDAEEAIREAVRSEKRDLAKRIAGGQALGEKGRDELREVIRKVLAALQEESGDKAAADDGAPEGDGGREARDDG